MVVCAVFWEDAGTQIATVILKSIVAGTEDFGLLYGATYVINISGFPTPGH